jgi:hypothetical protein
MSGGVEFDLEAEEGVGGCREVDGDFVEAVSEGAGGVVVL